MIKLINVRVPGEERVSCQHLHNQTANSPQIHCSEDTGCNKVCNLAIGNRTGNAPNPWGLIQHYYNCTFKSWIQSGVLYLVPSVRNIRPSNGSKSLEHTNCRLLVS